MSLGKRLKEERERLDLTQPVVADYADTTKNSVLNYEKDKVKPPCQFIEKIAPYGFDVQYIFTGTRSNTAITQEEKELLELFRNAPSTIKQAVKAVLTSGGNSTIKTVNFGKNNKIENSNIKIS